MHSRPVPVEHGITFDLEAIDREMRGEEAYLKNGHTAHTLVLEPDLRMVLIVLRDGARIAEHQARGSTTVHALSGRLRLHLADRTVELSPGQVLVMEKGLPHDVEAEGDSALLLTLGWTGSA